MELLAPITAVALFAVSGHAHAQAQRFNLVCEGRILPSGKSETRPFTMTLKVDLAAKRWCRDACGQVKPIFEILDAMITFEKSETPEGFSMLWVSRRTGEFAGAQTLTLPGFPATGQMSDGVQTRALYPL